MFVRKKEFEGLKRRVDSLETEVYEPSTHLDGLVVRRTPRLWRIVRLITKIMNYLGIEEVSVPPDTIIRKRKKGNVK